MHRRIRRLVGAAATQERAITTAADWSEVRRAMLILYSFLSARASRSPGTALQPAAAGVPGPAAIGVDVAAVALVFLIMTAYRRVPRARGWQLTVAIAVVLSLWAAADMLEVAGRIDAIPWLAVVATVVVALGASRVALGRWMGEAPVGGGPPVDARLHAIWNRLTNLIIVSLAIAALLPSAVPVATGAADVVAAMIGSASVVVLASYAVVTWRRHPRPARNEVGTRLLLGFASCLIIHAALERLAGG